MQNSPEQSQPLNNEIDLADLIRALWRGKWLILGFTLAGLALGIAYLMIAPKDYTGSLKISMLSDDQTEVYTEINTFERIIAPKQLAFEDYDKLLSIDKETLLTLFIEDLKTQKSGISNFSLDSNNPSFWVLSFQSQVQGDLTPILADSLALSTENVKQKIIQHFSRIRSEQLRQKLIALEELDLEREQMIVIYHAHIRAEVAALGEQAEILGLKRAAEVAALGEQAEILGLKNSSKSRTKFVSSSGIGTVPATATVINTERDNAKLELFIEANTPFMLNSHAAIEKAIELILSRDIETFIPDLSRIAFLKSKLLKNSDVKRIESLLEKTPISTDQFVAVNYNLDALVYKNNIKINLTLVFSILLGGILGVLVLLIRNVLVKQDNSK